MKKRETGQHTQDDKCADGPEEQLKGKNIRKVGISRLA